MPSTFIQNQTMFGANSVFQTSKLVYFLSGSFNITLNTNHTYSNNWAEFFLPPKKENKIFLMTRIYSLTSSLTLYDITLGRLSCERQSNISIRPLNVLSSWSTRRQARGTETTDCSTNTTKPV